MSIFKKFADQEDVSLEILQSSEAEIGMLEFKTKVDINKISNTFTKIANFELDIVAEDNTSKEIVVLDHDQTDFVMQYAAQDFQSFIKALACIEDFWDKCELNEELYDDFSEMEIIALKASIQAGGERYTNFYKCMFGI